MGPRAFCLAVCTAALLLAAPIANAEGFRIGLSLPLSGSASVVGKQFLTGARLAIEILAQHGDIELIVADDGCDGEIATLAIAELQASEPAMVTGLLCNEPAWLAVSRMAAAGVPVLAAGARSERLLKDAAKEGWRVWRLSPSDSDATRAAFRYLAPRWRGLPWAVVDDGTVYGRTQADEFRVLMEEAGNPPQFADNFRPAQSTQAGLIRRLQKAGVSAAFVSAAAEDTAIIAANVAEFGGKFEVAGGESLAGLPWLQNAESVPDGLLAIFSQEFANLDSAKVVRELLKDRSIDAEPAVLLGYATIEIAIAAFRNTNDETARALDESVFRTILGPIDFGPDGSSNLDRFRLHVWQGGQFRPMENGSAQ
ncbi:MAG: ABC transporter substrate-binding protein [Rhizobiaceae bacterium]